MAISALWLLVLWKYHWRKNAERVVKCTHAGHDKAHAHASGHDIRSTSQPKENDGKSQRGSHLRKKIAIVQESKSKLQTWTNGLETNNDLDREGWVREACGRDRLRSKSYVLKNEWQRALTHHPLLQCLGSMYLRTSGKERSLITLCCNAWG